jgi:hypothetical protein
MRAASATPFRESIDFTPKGNRAERVQTVNGPYSRWRYFSVSARLTISRCLYGRAQLIDVLGGPGCAQNIVGRNTVAFARERVAAVRSTDTFENAIPHEHLQDRFEMAWWQPMAGDCLGRYRPSAPQLPVEPKPPPPRVVSSRDAASNMCPRTTGVITN